MAHMALLGTERPPLRWPPSGDGGWQELQVPRWAKRCFPFSRLAGGTCSEAEGEAAGWRAGLWWIPPFLLITHAEKREKRGEREGFTDFYFSRLLIIKVEHSENSTTWYLTTTEDIYLIQNTKSLRGWEDRIYLFLSRSRERDLTATEDEHSGCSLDLS